MRMLEKYNIIPESERSRYQNFDVTPAAKWFLSENEKEVYDINEDFDHLDFCDQWETTHCSTKLKEKQNGKEFMGGGRNVGGVVESYQ